MVTHNFQPDIGDICADSTGLQVKVEDIDIYNYVHFFVIIESDTGVKTNPDGKGDCISVLSRHKQVTQKMEPEKVGKTTSGQMSCVAFLHRFTRVCHGAANRRVA
jgi:hypothetical protein